MTIAVAGDIHFEGVLRDRLDDPATALAPATATLAAADIAIVNLETVGGERWPPRTGKRFTFQAPPSASTALAAAGIDVATMANNHALDYGQDAAARHVRGHRGRGDLRSAARRRRASDRTPTRRSSPPGRRRRHGRRHDRGHDRRHRPHRRPHRAVGRHRGRRRDRRRRRPRAPAPAPSSRLTGRPTWSSSTCTGASRARPARPAAAVPGDPAGRGGRRRRRRQPRAPAPGRRAARPGLRRLRAGELRLVHPARGRDVGHRRADPDRAAGAVAGRAGHGDRGSVGAGAHRPRRTARPRDRPPRASSTPTGPLRACADWPR